MLLVYFLLRGIVGPLNPDEVYFSHTLWLTLQGKRQYVDFFSQHFPTYFEFYRLLLPSQQGLDVIWIVRLSNVAILLAYVRLLFLVKRKSVLYLLPLLLTFIVVSRMIEVRADTFGLLLFNAAWAVLLAGYSRRYLIVATLLACAAATFSARALAMGPGFAGALLWLTWPRRDFKAIALLSGIGLAIALFVALWFVLAPDYVSLVFQSTLIDPATLLTRLSIAQRLFALDRSPQVLLYLIAIGIAAASYRKQSDRAGIVLSACVWQLLLVLLDRAPFPYVYGWSAIPALAGVAMVSAVGRIDGAALSTALGSAFAAAMFAMTISYPLLKGHQPPTASNYRVLPDAPLDPDALKQIPTDRLVQVMISGERQQSLSNQLAVRLELCGRLRVVVATWQNHPVCVQDANYYWYEIKWPDLYSDGARVPTWFAAIFRDDAPDVFIFAATGPPARLSPSARAMLAGYDVYAEGYAIRRSDSSRTGSTPSRSARN